MVSLQDKEFPELPDEEENDNLSVNPMHITDYFPKPHQLYYLFASSLITVFDEDTSDTIKAFQSVKFAYELYKYFIFYIIIIDRGYFNGLELYTNEKKEKEQLRSIIEIVLYGEGKEYGIWDFCELLGLKESRTKDILKGLSDRIEIIGSNRDRRYKKKYYFISIRNNLLYK